MRTLSAFAVLALTLGTAPGQGLPGNAKTFQDVANVTVEFVPAKAKRGEVVTLKVTVTPKPGCWTYPTNPPPDQSAKNTIPLPKIDDVFFLVKDVADPEGLKEKPDPNDPSKFDLHYPKRVTWEAKAVLSPTATPGKKGVPLPGSTIQACNESNCFYLRKLEAELEILDGPAVETPESKIAFPTAGTRTIAPAPGVATTPPPTTETPPVVTANTGGDGLIGLLVTAAFWGFVSLVTPCVFPMIPITVSLFLKQSQQSSTSALKLAAVYCLTIVLVLGAAAALLLPVFQALSVHPYTNIVLGGLLFVFALSLFGMFDLTLPGFLLRSAEKGRASGGVVGTVFGAIAFSIVSFTCVAPFLGGFAGMAASGQYTTLDLVLAGITFAVAFASPFFVLALFPSWLKKLPKSGGWLDTIKAVMGFLELAAAVKFFRTAELILLPQATYFTYDVCLVAWVVVSGACGLYLLNLFRLPHDEERPNIGVVRMVFALAFLGLAVHLVPAVFKTADGGNQRPNGIVFAWVDSFLLPEPSADKKWRIDLPAEVARIEKDLRLWELAKLDAAKAGKAPPEAPKKRHVFIDFTGVTCTNCKLNERNVFPRPEIKELMDQYTLVALYTDAVPAELYDAPPSTVERSAQAEANRQYQLVKYGTVQLPLYVILEPQASGDPKVVAVYDEGKINNVPAFAEFLKQPLGQK